MNNEKLKIALCGYLPYGVKGLNQANTICSLEAAIMTDCIWRPDKMLFRGQAYSKVKPLLFPIQSLTNEIQLADYNNGEPFVPIVEIGKLFYKFELTRYELDNDIIEYGWEEKGMSDSQYYSFGYYKNGTFGVWHYEIDEDMPIYTECSLEAIDLLNRWKIDYRGLIAEGLAIEVNEENNPYL